MRNLRMVLGILLLLVVAACSNVRYMSVQTLQPARFVFPEYVRSVLFLNQTAARGSAVCTEVSREGRTDYSVEEEARGFLKRIADGVAADSAFREVLAADVPPALDSVSIFSYDQAMELRAGTGAQAIVTLSELWMESSLYQFGQNEVLLTMPVKMVFRIYLPGKQLPDYRSVSDTLYWRGSGYSPEQALMSVPVLADAVDEALLYLADKQIADFIPRFREESRVCFTPQTPEMEDAERYARREEWKEAGYLWEYAYEHSRKAKIRGMAAYNAGLAAEMQDDYTEAVVWIGRAKKEFAAAGKTAWRDQAAAYELRLQARSREDRQLQRQLKP